jgi:uncharacterized protein (TIGR00255 family)
MTGYGAGEAEVVGGRVRIEVRTVNHRYFNLSLKLPQDLAALEAPFREFLKGAFERGHIAVSGRWVTPPESGLVTGVDIERARPVVARLRELRQALRLDGDIDLSLVLRQPEVMAPPAESPEVPWEALEPAAREAVAGCQAMREGEGAALADELRLRLDLMESAAGEIGRLAPARVVRERDRLRMAVQDLLDGAAPDETRVAQEIAFLADKLDITEELVRFAAHVTAARQALGATGPVGKQLGFLAQEMGREVNTMGSKANDAGITAQVILMKGELEKFREQLENLE